MWITFAARRARGTFMLSLLPGAIAGAQTDYFNTDRGRPLHVQDATAIERYAFELQAAPLRWSRPGAGRAVWAIEPELAYGLLPRTQLEIGLPVFVTEGFDGDANAGIGAIHISLLHALNIETLGMPGLAVEAAAAIPVGDFGPRRVSGTVGGLLSRTLGFGRLHLNADVTLGTPVSATDDGWATAEAAGLEELSRWTAGVAIDRALPLRSMLLGAELVARQPILAGSDLSWHAAAGVRWQLDPRWALDAGIGRTLNDEPEWSLTIGAARSFGLIRFMKGARP